MQNRFFNHQKGQVYISRLYLANFAIFLFALFGFCFFSCGGKKENIKAQKKIEITITGLDGNGIAEKKITNDLMGINGIKTISFNYLNNQVVVLYDTTVTSQSVIITTIMKSNEGKHKVLDIKTNKEPLKKDPEIKPDPQEDIHDDTGDEYKNSG